MTPKLIHDLFARLQENPHIKQPIYMIEIFTKETKRKDKGTIAIENNQFKEYLISIMVRFLQHMTMTAIM